MRAPGTASPEPLPLQDRAFAERASPFLEAGLLDLASIHVVDLLALEAPGLSADVLLGLAFAVQAPRGGSVGVELAELPTQLEGGEAKETTPPVFPVDPAAWQRAVHACALVSPDAPRAPFVVEHGLLLTRRYAGYQTRLRDRLLRLVDDAPPGIGGGPLDEARAKALLAELFPPSDEPEPGTPNLQLVGTASSLLQRLTIICGGPGTGKTFTIKKVLALAQQLWLHAHGRAPRVALVAPTGKAAVRMREAIRAEPDKLHAPAATFEWLTSLVPETIHRLLGFQPGSPTRYRHGADNPLPHELVVVDESSMVDLALMCKLVEAVGPSARLILLGDKNQLASVEAGSVLADLTRDPRARQLSPARAKALKALLRKGAIDETSVVKGAPRLADAIVQFEEPRRVGKDGGLHALAYRTLALVSGDTPEAIAANAGPLAAIEAWLSGEAAEGRGPFPELRLRPHERAGLSDAVRGAIIEAYATYLELLLAGRGAAPGPVATEEEHHANVLRALEQVRVLTPHREGTLGVSGLNQTIQQALFHHVADHAAWRSAGAGRGTHWLGRPVMVTENDHELGVMNGDVGVVVEREVGGRAVAFPAAEPGRVLYLSPAQLPSHETVFAMTIHKSQGSEFPHTFLVLPTEPSRLLTRELVYTAMTRAKKTLTVCGAIEVLRAGLVREVRRASGLGEGVWGGDSPAPAPKRRAKGARAS